MNSFVFWAIVKMIIAIVIGFPTMYLIFKYMGYYRDKESEYGNDERWMIIKLKASNVVRRYYDICCLTAAAIYLLWILAQPVVLLIFGKILPEGRASLIAIFATLAMVAMFSVIVEYFALRYYDKNM